MTVREYLARAMYLRAEIRRLNEHIMELRAMAQTVGAIKYDKINVQSSPEDRMANVVFKIVESEKKAAELISEYTAAYDEIQNRIKEMPSERYQIILSLRYLDGKPIWQVAEEIGYSVDWTKHLLQRAVRAFGDVF